LRLSVRSLLRNSSSSLTGRTFLAPRSLPLHREITGVRPFKSSPARFDQESELNNPDAKTFAEAGVSESRLGLLKSLGLEKMFPIQEQTFAAIREGKDVVARAKTGSGKTLAFALPLVERYEGQTVRQPGAPSIVILAPTRELALQVHGEINKVSSRMKSVCVYGGQSVGFQARALQSKVDIVVGTPGRMIHFINEGILDLNNVQAFVLDEADQMLDIGFKTDIEEIMKYMPENKQTLLFSATLPPWIRSLTSDYMRNPQFVDLIGNQLTPTEVTHGYIQLQLPSQRVVALGQLIAKHRDGKMLIFVDTKTECAQLASHPLVSLRAVRTLHGDVNQHDRAATLDAFRSGACKIVIATDVAARGLDIPGVDIVIHFRPTKRIDSYIHRSGRCGRAGKTGTSISLISPEDFSLIRSIEKTIKTRLVEFPLPTQADLDEVNMNSVLSLLDNTSETSVKHYQSFANNLLEKENGSKLFAAELSLLSGKSSNGEFSMLSG
jgi:ATP-dependent RNA helicase DDX21